MASIVDDYNHAQVFGADEADEQSLKDQLAISTKKIYTLQQNLAATQSLIQKKIKETVITPVDIPG